MVILFVRRFEKIKLQVSTEYQAVMARIRRLPKIYIDAVDTTSKKDAMGIMHTWAEGIAKNLLGLEPLSPVTIEKKSEQGLSKPSTPLYGRGISDAKSYINMLRMVKIRNGYRIKIRNAMHWSGKINLQDLFIVHEFGTTITRESGKTIRIPPRPAFNRSYNKYLRKKRQEDPANRVRKAINKYIKEGKENVADIIGMRERGEL